MWEEKDIKKVLVSEEEIKARAAVLGKQIAQDYQG
jgi:hypoxanthine-guanine phosphoribosyltransferase